MPVPAPVIIKYKISPLHSLLKAKMHICPGHMTAVTTEINYRLVTSPTVKCLGAAWVPKRGGNSQGDHVFTSSAAALLLWFQTGMV